MEEFLKKAKLASRVIANLSSGKKKQVLIALANALRANKLMIIEENKKDLAYGKEANLSSALMDRLLLDEGRVESMAEAIQEIAILKEPVGRVIEGWNTDNNLKIEKISVPIGVISIIYESRPNVTSDTAALCFKSGNVCVLKGGKEAINSNKAIAKVLQDALEKEGVPKEAISLIPDSSREGVASLIKMDKYVDLVIPRGGEKLIKFVNENATVPVVKHDKGLCHVYIHKDADAKKAVDIAINSKTHRTGVCNAAETLLIDEEIAPELLPILKSEFDKKSTLLKGCVKTRAIIDTQSASHEDYNTEYLDNILNIKVVKHIDEALDHISIYGSSHSESIVSENYNACSRFMQEVDASTVYTNASTRFTDGGMFGFGAEVGISTNKLHSRGPMGINDLTTYKYCVYGHGQIRE
ncbi:MAG: glutamate-5-semialdehyde dehydrogenase [Campylobacterales bacterium]